MNPVQHAFLHKAKRALRAGVDARHIYRLIAKVENSGTPSEVRAAPTALPSREVSAREADPVGPLRRGPTAEQWRAVSDAIQKYCGRGKWSVFSGPASLPYFDLRWDDPDLPADKAASTHFEDGSLVVCLRSDVTAEAVHRHMLHELQHVVDLSHPLTRQLPVLELERRARCVVEQKAHW